MKQRRMALVAALTGAAWASSSGIALAAEPVKDAAQVRPPIEEVKPVAKTPSKQVRPPKEEWKPGTQLPVKETRPPIEEVSPQGAVGPDN